MDKIFESSKQYEIERKKHSQHCSTIIRGNNIVIDFIKKNNLIVYGGTAIDAVLRLKGQKIYPDELLPFSDFDFLSPENIKHSYELVDILYNNGYEEARSIVAMHPTTMKVDIGGKNWIADISHVPQPIFDNIPTVEYNGMRMVAPDYLRIDLHKGLSFPFVNNAALTRTAKDIKRLNLIDTYYPISYTIPPGAPHEVKLPIKNDSVLTGMFAFLIYKETLISLLGKDIPKEFLENLRLKSQGKISEVIIPSHIPIRYDFLTTNCIPQYNSYSDIIPARCEVENVRLYKIEGEVSITNLEFATISRKCASLQYIMSEALSRYFLMGEADGMDLYVAAIELLKLVETLPLEKRSLFYPSLEVYGDSKGGIYETLKTNLDVVLKGKPAPTRASSYYKVKNGKVKTEHPPYDMNKITHYMLFGQKITSS